MLNNVLPKIVAFMK